MGLFDDVKCEFPLGNEEVQNLAFQTKDLDCCMLTYRIDSNGRLWFHHTKGEYDPFTPEEEEEEKKKYLKEDGALSGWADFFIRRGKYRETLNEWLPQDNITDTVEFYTSVEDKDLKYPDNWVEFRATFLNGYMQSLTVLQMPERLRKDIPLGPVAMPHAVGQMELRYNGKVIASCEIVTTPTNTAETVAALKVMIEKLENTA